MLAGGAQGLADTGIRLRWETVRRPEPLRYLPLAEGYRDKLIATYDWLEENLGQDDPLHIGHIAVATALSWLAFRGLPEFRGRRAKLSEWFAGFQQRASMLSTPLSGETVDVRPV